MIKPANFNVNGVEIGDENEPIVIAELGINHGGNLDVAKQMAKEAIKFGAKFIKNQSHSLIDEMSEEAKEIIPGNATESIHSVISSNLMSEEDEWALKEYVEGLGAVYFTTPFSLLSIERISNMNLPLVKIGSGEANNYPFVERVARLGKPVILSTGMNTIETIRPSVEILRHFRLPFALLHCTNLYPTPAKLVRLEAIKELKENFPDAVIGLSDHSTTIYPCIASVALGASVLERHFTDSRNRPGPDIPCSMDGPELKSLIDGAREVYYARGGEKSLLEEEGVTRAFAFSSVVAIQDIKPGDLLTTENIWVMRPSGGYYSPADFANILGKKALLSARKGFQIPKGII